MVSKERIELDTLFEVFNSFSASDLFQEIEVTIYIHASSYQSMPMHTLDFYVSIVLLKLEIYCFEKVYVWSLYCVHVHPCHLELVKVEVLRKDLHFIIYYY